MREINECTAEVFRRSEKRIKERKRNRNRILAFCIPLCLIVTVFSVMILPAMMPAMNTKNAAAEIGDTAGSPAYAYNAVEIHDNSMLPEHYEKVTDKVAVTRIFNVIYSLFVNVDEAAQNGGANSDTNRFNADNASPTEVANNASKMKDYTVIFTTEDGAQTVYTLSGNTLLNVNTNESIVLSDAQVARLMIALVISE